MSSTGARNTELEWEWEHDGRRSWAGGWGPRGLGSLLGKWWQVGSILKKRGTWLELQFRKISLAAWQRIFLENSKDGEES